MSYIQYERAITGDSAPEMSILKDSACGYVSLLVKISKDLKLPYHEELAGLKNEGRLGGFNCEGVDAFIDRYAKEYKDENYRVRDISVILDADSVAKDANERMESGCLSDEGVELFGKRLMEAKNVLEIGLQRVYSVHGKKTDRSFEDLYDSFFNSGSEIEIKKAEELRNKFFGSHLNNMGDTNSVVSYWCGSLSGSAL